MAERLSSSLHPLTPPLKEEERLSWLRLIRSRRVGVSTFYRLMNENGSANACLEVLPEIASDAGLQKYQVFSEKSALAELANGRKLGARLIAISDPDYPSNLKNVQDPPPLVWCLGNTDVLQRPMIALVGARNASSLGTRMAKRLAQDLANSGFVVVSGLARGIDAAAHLGSLEKGTVAVMAGGVDVLYPAENAAIGKHIVKSGLRISEAPIGLQPRARNFPQRNRLISGLSLATVVIEAASQSGSLITARIALDQGRDVFAVPGHPFDGRATGCNHLIRDGATLIRNADDIMNALDQQLPQGDLPVSACVPKPTPKHDPSRLRVEILNKMGPSPIAEDKLIRDLGAAASDVSAEIVALEIDGHIERAPGGLLSLLPTSTH